MTELTKLWKKGELTFGAYYVNRLEEHRIWLYSDRRQTYDNCYEINEVLTEVPSYEEWQAKLDENTKLKKELKEICEKYLEIQTTVSAYEDVCKDLKVYIKQLKELLKECRENIASIDYDSPVLDREQSILLNKIDQVLQEKE